MDAAAARKQARARPQLCTFSAAGEYIGLATRRSCRHAGSGVETPGAPPCSPLEAISVVEREGTR